MIGLAWVFVQRSLQIATSLERGRAAERERLILKENEHSLQTSRERYRALFDEVPIAIQEEDWSRIRSEIMLRMSASGGTLREATHQLLSEG
ncbi:MAG: hypothetical protein GTO41_27570, partial [Burkholderiales bacterium]|nr:hypothetical protein [Burkholderiales bacterium]